MKVYKNQHCKRIAGWVLTVFECVFLTVFEPIIKRIPPLIIQPGMKLINRYLCLYPFHPELAEPGVFEEAVEEEEGLPDVPGRGDR
jgi:hypothetical protein